MPSRSPVYIVASVRTPVGAFQGVVGTDLGSRAIKAALARVPALKACDVEEVFFGNVLSAGMGMNVARQCALGAGLPVTTICTTINKVCASAMKAVTLGVQTIQLGDADIVIAGGTESMSNAPFYVPADPSGNRQSSPERMLNSILTDGMMDAYGRKEHLGLKGEQLAKKFAISRAEQDAFAVESYRKAQVATQKGWFREEIIPVKVSSPGRRPVLVKEDEAIAMLDEAKLVTIPPVFVPNGGTIAAANSPTFADGASAVVLVSEAKLRELRLTPLARILGTADAATHPAAFMTAPAMAIPKALRRAGLDFDDVDVFEINEAFSVATLANLKLMELDASKVNVHGGSVALGHPLGASGCRIIATLLGVLKRQKNRIGVAAICNGGGGATAIVLENMQRTSEPSRAAGTGSQPRKWEPRTQQSESD